MFCYQCEQTARGEGCNRFGVCGKDPDTAALQDLLIWASRGIAQYAHLAGEMGERADTVDRFLIEALFSTVTNVNFDADAVEALVKKAAEVRQVARDLYESACGKVGTSCRDLSGPASEDIPLERGAMVERAGQIGIEKRLQSKGEDITGLEELITYGLKGAAAYADHALILGVEDEGVFADFARALSFLTEEHQLDELLAMALKVGELNLRVMEQLDTANTTAFGHPEPTAVRVSPVGGKAILVSGHDLRDLKLLLEQTEGLGINVYTHGEMLPSLAYPELAKHSHLAGNYGGAWQDQQKEFADFPGAILMTTNCIQKPADSYIDRIFTTGLVRWPGAVHVGEDKDFSPVIEAALNADGFSDSAEERTITIGFGHDAVLGVADKVVEAVKSGAIRRFFLIGGCDGAKSGRNYYTELAEAVPDDAVILTLACGKFRFNKLDFGEVDGIPRLLDIGQCNDAYSAIRIASALAEAFGVGVNELPLSLVLSWYEQKAVAILLTLLHLGIRGIRIGPSLPAFVTPAALQVLVDEFAIRPIATPEEDLAAAMAGQ